MTIKIAAVGKPPKNKSFFSYVGLTLSKEMWENVNERIGSHFTKHRLPGDLMFLLNEYFFKFFSVGFSAVGVFTMQSSVV